MAARWSRRNGRHGRYGYGYVTARGARADSIPTGIGYERRKLAEPCLYPPSWHSKAPRYGAFFIFPLAAWGHPAPPSLLHCLPRPAREERATVLEETRMRILIAEDDAVLADGLTRSLRHRVIRSTASRTDSCSGTSRTLHGAVRPPDPGRGLFRGFEILKRLRGRNAELPVLILTASTAWTIASAGYDLGADDYLAKPFQLAELEARVRALTRRSAMRRARPCSSTEALARPGGKDRRDPRPGGLSSRPGRASRS